MFDYIAVDWGEKRCGIAFGSLETKLILPRLEECYTKDIWGILATEINQKKIENIVIGLPTNFFGFDTLVSTKIQAFIKDTELVFPDLNIFTINERSSTKEAKKLSPTKKDKHDLNNKAAAKILEYYFLTKRN